MMNKIPYYMNDMIEEYELQPREAKKTWLRKAQYGLFLHYGLFSVHDCYQASGTQEWCQLKQKMRVNDYAKLKDKFDAKEFDADYIVKFAKSCGMKYINMVTRHHDSFCLWNTQYTDFNSMNSLAKRDLVEELYVACKKENIGLMLYYSHGRDWKHPHAPNNDKWKGSARPEYEPREEQYCYGKEHDLNQYLLFMKNQITELIKKFPDIIGIWLDGQAVPVSGNVEEFQIQDLYDHIHSLSEHMLVSYKQGILGTEDFFTPEHYIPTLDTEIREETQEFQKIVSRVGKIAEVPDKLIEVNTTMIHDPISWGYTPFGTHFTAQEIYEKIQDAKRSHANFVMNTGVMGSGKIDPIDDAILREVGTMLKL